MGEAESVIAVQRVRTVGAEALAEVLHAHRPLICGLARRVAGAGSDLEDVVQDALVAIAASLPRFRGECRLSTWIAGITVRTALRHAQRRRQRETRVASLDASEEAERLAVRGAEDPSGRLEAKEFAACVQASIDRLPPDQRAVVALRHVEGLTLHEIAETLRLPLGTVKSRLHHARQALRQMMAPYLAESGGETP